MLVFHKTLSICVAGLISLPVIASSSAQAAKLPKGYDKCLKAVMSGQDDGNRREVTIYKHDFWCKPARRKSENGGKLMIVSGTLSHILRFRKDDQFHYSFKYDRCKGRMIGSVNFRTNRGGIAPIIGQMGRLIGKDGWEKTHRERARDWDGDWKPTAAEFVYYLAENFNQISRFNPKIATHCKLAPAQRRVPTKRKKVRDHRNG